MRHAAKVITTSAMLAMLATTAWAQGARPLRSCPSDSVPSGTVCMDRFEASVWRVPNPTTDNRGLVARIQKGKATLAHLQEAGATQLGATTDDYAPCADSGQSCANDIFAVSIPDVLPSQQLTWFQAQEACRNARKRLPSNAEWQATVAGTPDPGPDDGATDCNTNSAGAAIATGSRSSCVSADGAFDMVGNVQEWVADWVQRSDIFCLGTWSPAASPTDDFQCMAGLATAGEPGALLRGGEASDSGPRAGPFSVISAAGPSIWAPNVGFRCAR